VEIGVLLQACTSFGPTGILAIAVQLMNEKPNTTFLQSEPILFVSFATFCSNFLLFLVCAGNTSGARWSGESFIDD
jgi:hypothetical protein